jgi:hypothetical protein
MTTSYEKSPASDNLSQPENFSSAYPDWQDWWDWWESQPLLAGPLGRWDLRLSLGGEILPPAGNLRPLRGSYGNDFLLSEDEGEIKLWCQQFTLILDFARRQAEARLAGPEEYQNLLRILYFFEFLKCGGLLMHASSVVRQGRACIFPGQSGAGKTTIVRNSTGLSILTDEMSAVQTAANGAPPLAYGTPFYGDWNQVGEKLTAPVKGFYFPVQDGEHRAVPISPGETLTRLLPRIVIFTTWQPRIERILDLAVQLAERAPGYLLHFRPQPALWEAIDES